MIYIESIRPYPHGHPKNTRRDDHIFALYTIHQLANTPVIYTRVYELGLLHVPLILCIWR